ACAFLRVPDMRKLLFVTAVASLGWLSAANASLVSVTFEPFGNGVLPPSLPGGATLVDFAGLTTTGNAGLITGGTAPAFSTTTFDTAQYLSVGANATATLTLPKETGVQLYIGSFDSFNQLTFSNGLSYTGSD